MLQHAGEVYGEKSILATEVKELENRLLNLSEERNKSLTILDEVCFHLLIIKICVFFPPLKTKLR